MAPINVFVLTLLGLSTLYTPTKAVTTNVFDIVMALSFESLLSIAQKEHDRVQERIDIFAEKFHYDAETALDRNKREGAALRARMEKAAPVCQKMAELDEHLAERDNDLQDLANEDIARTMMTDLAVREGMDKMAMNEAWLMDKITNCIVCNLDFVNQIVIRASMGKARKAVARRLTSMEINYSSKITSDMVLRRLTTQLTKCESDNKVQ